jgi:hypothetical protein
VPASMNMNAEFAFIATVPGTTARTTATLHAHPTTSTTAPASNVHAPHTIAILRALDIDRSAAVPLRSGIRVCSLRSEGRVRRA